MENATNQKMSRRDFMKSSLAASCAAALGMNLTPTSSKSLVPALISAAASDEQWLKAYCSSCIWPNCQTLVKVKNDVALEVRGDPEGPFNKGTLCPRGSAILSNLYNPYRVKTPLKRTNPEKGLDVDPGWVEISWEEALGTIAEKLKEVRDKDPRRFAVMLGFSSRMTETKAPVLFPTAFGTPHQMNNAGPLCAVHYGPQLHHGTYVDKIDLGFCEYLITIGRTVGANFMKSSGPARALADALDRGMKFVVVDPRCSTEAAKADEWLPIRPGTDLAFGLALLNVILYELDRYDVESVKLRTNGPYLIGENRDYVRDPESGKPLVWDSGDNAAKPFDAENIGDYALDGTYEVGGQTVRPAFALLKENAKDYPPEWAENITTIPAETIRRIATEFVDAAHLGETITLDGVTYPYRPVCLAPERGAANHVDGQDAYFLFDVINIIMGASDTPGAMCSVEEGPPWYASGPDGTLEVTFPGAGQWSHLHHGTEFSFPTKTLDLTTFYPIGHNTTPTFAQAYAKPEAYHMPYELEALMTFGGNGIINNASVDEPVEMYKKIPFVFSISYHFDEPTLFSDIVLPENADLERYQVYHAHDIDAAGSDTINMHSTNYRYPVVSPIYDTKQAEDIFFEIAKRVGFLFGPGGLNFLYNQAYQLPETHQLALDRHYTYQEVCDLMLRGTHGDDKGEAFFKENRVNWTVPLGRNYNYNFNPTNRLEIYARSQMDVGRRLRDNLESVGLSTVPGWEFMDPDEFFSYYNPLPSWKNYSLFDTSAEYPLYVINWKISPRPLGIAGQDDNPWLREVVQKWELGGLGVHMNRATAEAIGLENGDRVIIQSQHGGKVEGTLFTTDLIHPEVIGIPGQSGHLSPQLNPITREGTNFNQLISGHEGHISPTSAAVEISARVKVMRA